MNPFVHRLGIEHPIIQAPMAGVSTPALAAAVSNAGGLGSLSLGAMNAAQGSAAIAALKGLTSRPFNINVFTHRTPQHDRTREADWITILRPAFAACGAEPPATLASPYTSFNDDDDMARLLVAAAPAVASFHFGLPDHARIVALKNAGVTLLATVTTLAEAQAARSAGIDMLVAQGYEAGGHRGIFDPASKDDCLGTAALTRLLVKESGLPVISAGGIMDGAGIAAVLALGACAAQLGTAFVCCPESSASAAHRAALMAPQAETVMTTAISGRPARGVANSFTRLDAQHPDVARPDYPIAYAAGKALHAAASAAGDTSYGAHWAGQGLALARPLPAAEIMNALTRELHAAQKT